MTVKNFMCGVYLTSSSYNRVVANKLSSNGYCGIDLMDSSNYNTIFNNTVNNNFFGGIEVSCSSPIPTSGSSSNFNNISFNMIEANMGKGLIIINSTGAVLYNNYVSDNGQAGIYTASSSNDIFYLNSIVGNSPNVEVGGELGYWLAGGGGIGNPSTEIWNNASVGNYWSDYEAKYPNATEIDSLGIGNTPYAIDQNNIDYYPLMRQANDSNPTPTVFQTPIPSATATSIPAVSEFPAIIFLSSLLSVFSIAVVLRHRKTTIKPKGRKA